MLNYLGRIFTQSVSGVLGGLKGGLEKLIELPRNIKQACLLALDMGFVTLAMWAAVVFRYGHLNFSLGPVEYFCAGFTVLASAIIFLRLGLYRAVIRFMGQQAIWAVITAVSYSSLILGATVFFTQADVPRSMPFIYWVLAMLGIGGTRLSVRAYYQAKLRSLSENVVIYGAGESGRQLLTALNHGDQYRPVVFVDDDPRLHNSVINGLQVVRPEEIERLITEYDITQVLLAIPSATADRRKEIINSLVGLPVYVRTVPRIAALVAGEASVNQIQDVDLDDLLGRDPVPPHPELIDRCITDKVVMVTGAGGSIGSELCRQIVKSGPRELVLLDNSEYALYNIERELRAMMDSVDCDFELVSLLGTVQDSRRLENIYRTFKVETVYHAAAYKHVPMVEYNVAEGVANNVFGTWYAAEAARKAGVDTFVLVSTDKAVRPTNIMGASKRFAEMILQGLAQKETKTRFCMVRFGNVLGSSGSVVPLFREQIESGGPVTVTHPEVTRYFMSIAEAAQLVLQASAMGTGGDVFVLDMGEPVRIVDLARRMIRLSGYEMNHDNHVGHHIDIEFIGLRPGEKLYEELLLGSNVAGTGHPMIMRAEEECLSYGQMHGYVSELMRYCDGLDCAGITEVLRKAVSGFSEQEVRHDYIWNKQADQGSQPKVPVVSSNVKELFPEKSS
ncbi:polysaccharide biosynthesis protein [Pseudohalioglobus sediminis]|uniref:Polysaccharide biosynthesis protein n=1 Tax=Pseudohalioglobus sediminis TaxID=2606449 RepID=A0A5B0X1H7_9GAMM|nr:nucleoside-diphosphate sugar epimerase/dehydratase [Pseudohalioglobus sediminis]KAA1192427.1 polysaccharide biosynthesis protein [Pseudohalioglobus sediminis]